MRGRRIRAVLALMAMVVGTALMLAAPGQAQESPPPSIASTSTERESTTVPSSLIPVTNAPTTDAPGVTVLGNVILPTTLPRTGGELGPEMLIGAVLLSSGVVLAIGARRRRNSVLQSA